MGTIVLQSPTVGQLNATEDPKITSDMNVLQALLNGNVDTNNLAVSAGILQAQLVSGSMFQSATFATTAYAAVPSDWVIASPSQTITLPPAAINSMIGVQANGSVTGTTPVTISTGGTPIVGTGLAGAGVTTLTLGTPLASVVFRSDGTHWVVVGGQIDSGWVPLTLAGGVTAAAGAYVPAVRCQGDVISLRGWLYNGSGGNISSGTTLATVPAVGLTAAISVLRLPCVLGTGFPGALTYFGGALSFFGNVAAADSVVLDSISYSKV